MTGWNLPPGCSTSDLPGNTPADQAAEAQAEAIIEAMAKAGFSEEIMNSVQMDDAIIEIAKLMDTSYKMGYDEGKADEAMYRDWRDSDAVPD